jgi:arylsulfatase A-like enzyme
MKDLDKSWSMSPSYKGLPKRVMTPGGYAIKKNQELFKLNKKIALEKYGPENSGGLAHGPAFEAGPVSDETYGDGYNTLAAINTLPKLKDSKKPWFIALGFSKPHLPFVAPKKYFDLYDPQKINLSEQTHAPKLGAAIGLHASFEMRTRANIPKDGQIDSVLSRKLKHAYYACTSYVDAQIGKMLKALEEQGMRENTIVVVWGDHGWHLGEYGIWGKATNYEIATRVPLIISAPKMKAKGKSSTALVELVDLYPTLVELCGLEMPSHLEGKSLVKLLDQPNLKWKEGVYSQFPSPALREWAASPLSEGMRQTFFGPLIERVESKVINQMGDKWNRKLFENDLMGYAYRTDQYRFVAWLNVKNKDDEPLFVELYDHVNDPEERVNIASESPELSQKLLAKLRSNWNTKSALSQ